MRAWWLGAVTLAVAVSAHGQEYLSPPPDVASPITDFLALRAIYSVGKVATHAEYDPSATPNQPAGTNFNAEQLLGLTDKADQFRVELILRLEDRSRVRMNFLDLRRGGDTDLKQPLVFGNITFNTGQPVQSEFDYREFDLTYTYSFLKGSWYELGAGAGVQLLEVQANVDVPATPKYANSSGAGLFGAPALDGTVLLDRHWSLNARAQYLHAVLHSATGLYEDFHADVQYRWRRNLGAGIGFEYQQADVRLTSGNPVSQLRLRIVGPEAFLRASF